MVSEARDAADATLLALRLGDAEGANERAAMMVVELLPRISRFSRVVSDDSVVAAQLARDSAATRLDQARTSAAAAAWLLEQMHAEAERLVACSAGASVCGNEEEDTNDEDAAARVVCERRMLAERVRSLERIKKEAVDAVGRRERAVEALQQKGAAPLADIVRIGTRLATAAQQLPCCCVGDIDALPDALFVLLHVVAGWGKARVSAVDGKAVVVSFTADKEVLFTLLNGLGVVAVDEKPAHNPPLLERLVEGDIGTTLPTLRARYVEHIRHRQQAPKHSSATATDEDSSLKRTYHWAQWLAGIPGDQLQLPIPAASAVELLDRIQQLMSSAM